MRFSYLSLSLSLMHGLRFHQFTPQNEARVTNLVLRVDVGALAAEGDLDAGGAPGDEVHEAPFMDALQRLVHLRRVHLSLDDVQDAHVAAALRIRVDHLIR